MERLIKIIENHLDGQIPGYFWGFYNNIYFFEEESFNYGNLTGYSVSINKNKENKYILMISKERKNFSDKKSFLFDSIYECLGKIIELQDKYLYRQNKAGALKPYTYDPNNKKLKFESALYDSKLN